MKLRRSKILAKAANVICQDTNSTSKHEMTFLPPYFMMCHTLRLATSDRYFKSTKMGEERIPNKT